jgi:hypothetical protein
MITFNENRLSRFSMFKKVLYHPLTWLALGLHVLLLIVPLKASSPAVESEAAKPEAVEDIPIDVLNLSEISTSTPPANSPPAAAAPPVTSRPASAPVNPAPVNAPVPAPVNAPVAQNPATSVAATPSPSVTSQSQPSPGSTSSSAASPAAGQPAPYDPAADQGVFISGLQNLGVQNFSSTLGLPNDPNMFRRASSFGFFLDNSDPNSVRAIAQAREAQWLEKQVSDLLPMLQSTYAGGNLTFNPIEDYGGEALYEIKTAQGQTVMYVSLVELKGSSLLVTWLNKPI